MNLTETAQLMTMIAAFSGRNVDKSAVVAWQSVLGDIDLADAEEAVRRHFASSTDFLMVAHVRREVEQIKLERAKAARKWAPGQAGVAPEDALPEIEGPTLSAAAIAGMPPELRAFLNKLAEEKGLTPEQARERLAPRQTYWERHQRDFQRTEKAEPNPLYKPS